jgi:hypothetical protein
MSALALPAIASFNTTLYLGGPTSPPSYVAVGRVGNIKFGGIAIDIVDVSNQTSTAHRKLATLLNPGDMTFDLFWEPAATEDQELFNLVIAAPPVLQQWKVVFALGTDGTAWLFNGYLSKFPADASIGKALMAAGSTIAIDGGIAVVYGAGPT